MGKASGVHLSCMHLGLGASPILPLWQSCPVILGLLSSKSRNQECLGFGERVKKKDCFHQRQEAWLALSCCYVLMQSMSGLACPDPQNESLSREVAQNVKA